MADVNKGSGEGLLLKVTPPRVPRHLMARPRLRSDAEPYRGRSGVLVRAPAGFGKSSLLAQWRLEHIGHGHGVAWLRADRDDTPDRLLAALVMAVQVGLGRPGFGRGALAAAGAARLTAWLSELAQSALKVTLMVDDTDRLPPPSQGLLVHLLRQAPPNLSVVLAGRGALPPAIEDLLDYGRCALVGAGALRFRLDETLEFVRRRVGPSADNHIGARLQALTEGWPLGLQFVLASLRDGDGLPGLVRAMDCADGELRRHFAEMLLGPLSRDGADFLTRMACLEQLHPDLCRAVEGRDDTPERLARLGLALPAFVKAEHSDWQRLHGVARDTLRRRFDTLPAEERRGLHARAVAWFEQHALLEDAARHAFAAGFDTAAFDLAERCLYDAVVRQGRQAAALDWLDRLPPHELVSRPRLMLAAAWSLSGTERHAEAEGLVAGLLARPDADDALRCEVSLIQSGAALFADAPDRFCELQDPWEQAPPPLRSPELLRIHANRSAYRALLDGQTALARLRLQRLTRPGESEGMDPAAAYLTGLSYLWEGQPLLAEGLLHPALARAEAGLGRRDRVPCWLAAVLAAALWELDQARSAEELLADRLDVLEHTAPAEPLILAYRTVARCALAAGAEHRAIELLERLLAVGQARGMPRLQVASLWELSRLHARRFRGQACREAAERIDELVAEADAGERPRWWRSVSFMIAQARGFVAIAEQDWRLALAHFSAADEVARRLRMGRVHIELLGLRAYALDQCGERSPTLLREAVELARAFELRRVLADAHPGVHDLVRRMAGDEPPRPAPGVVVPRPAQPVPAWVALTHKEREVLSLLSRNLSNKEIGRAMQAEETTVKWHVKNLFAKLDAGSRKEVVVRARLLGVLPELD